MANTSGQEESKSIGHEILIAAVTAFIVALLSNAGVWYQFHHTERQDAVKEQYRVYLEVKQAFAAYWTAIDDYAWAARDNKLDFLFKELEQPQSTSTTNSTFTRVREYLETNCVDVLITANITNKTGQIIVTVVRTNVECAVTSIVESNFDVTVSNNIVIWKTHYLQQPERLLQREESATRAFYNLRDALDSAKPFFSAMVLQQIEALEKQKTQTRKLTDIARYREQIAEASVSVRREAEEEVLNRMSDDLDSDLEKHPNRIAFMKLLADMRAELKMPRQLQR